MRHVASISRYFLSRRSARDSMRLRARQAEPVEYLMKVEKLSEIEQGKR